MKTARSIFITNNGLSDHIGVAQVLPYLQGLARLGHDITVISVENPNNWKENAPTPINDGQGKLAFSPIFRRSGVAGRLQRFFVPLQMRTRLQSEMRRRAPDLIHCRSYMPLAPSLRAAKNSKAALLADVRGFWVDQRLEGGAWSPGNPIDRAKISHFRNLESRAYREADHIVTLTHDAKSVIENHSAYGGSPITVVPCSVDQTAFDINPTARAKVREDLGISDDTFVVCYLGSSSGVYRMDIVNKVYDAIRAQVPSSRLLLLGGHDAQDHSKAAAAHAVTLDAHEITALKVPHTAVPDYLNAADAGLSFQVSTPSSLGVSATKVGEYMACGLPVASNTGVGDISTIVNDGHSGAVLTDDSPAEIARVADVLIKLSKRGDRTAIKDHGRRFFSLEEAIARYDEAYQSLATDGDGS